MKTNKPGRWNRHNFMGLSLVTFLLGFLTATAQAQIQWHSEKSVNFQLDSSRLNQMQGQMSMQFVPLSKVTTSEFEAVLASDNLNQVSTAFDNITDDDKKIRKMLFVKSAFKVNQTSAALKKQLASANLIDLLSQINNFKVRASCINNRCPIEKSLNVFGINTTVNLDLDAQFYSLAAPTPEHKKILSNLNLSKAEYELRTNGSEWERIFLLSQSISYFIPDGAGTIIVSYQIYTIKDADYPPFVEAPLESGVSSVIEREFNSLVSYLRKM